MEDEPALSVPRRFRLLAVVLYAAFVGLLLASYVSPLQEIIESRGRVSALRADLEDIQKENAARERLVGELETPEGVERAARERYGMISPGEKVYIIPEKPEEEQQVERP